MQSAHNNSRMEPVAVVGMACRLPGNSSTPSKLWDLLDSGRSGQSDAPENRWKKDSFYHPRKLRPGSITTAGGYFLSNDDSFRNFDPSFFGINPLEAASMDPQQRKLLEVTYECFESAGVTLEELSGSQTATYVGCFNADIKDLQGRDTEYGIPYQNTGGGLTILSNRLSYVFNLKGPSMTIDTACSSSLYALHLACQSLNSGDCTAAVVGGANLIFGIEKQIGSVRLGVLSPTSTCHTFDESADGIGRGDGITAFYVKRLSDAIADGNPIRAVIRATAINANGKSSGINHPASNGQEAVMRKAYATAGLGFDQTAYVDMHGTGTPVGDRVETAAVGNVFASGRTPEEPLLIGTLKTNLGHTEGASGLASVMKVILSMEQGHIPATLGIKKLNPNLDFKGGRLKVVVSNTLWPERFGYRRASVNSFGYGGSNAHAIIDSTEDYLGQVPKTFKYLRISDERGNVVASQRNAHQSHPYQNGVKVVQEKCRSLLVFSGHDAVTLRQNIAAVARVVERYDLLDLSHTLASGRSKLQHRAYAIYSRKEFASQLSEDEIIVGAVGSSKPTIAFVFTGQGAQWPRMGYSLIKQFPSVLRTFQELENVLDQLPIPPDWSLVDALAEGPEFSKVYDTIRSQALCTAVQIALVNLLESWGIHADAVAGHSSGEVAAAYAAGALTAAEAITIAYYRGVAIAACYQPGAMMAVGLGAEKVAPHIESLLDLVIACYNSPESVTLSGDEAAIDEVGVTLKKAGIFARKLNTSGNAYHSHLVKKAGQYYQKCFQESELASVFFKTSKVPMYSSLTGGCLGKTDFGVGYWRGNLESPVLFDQAMQALLSEHPSVNCIIEIGPHAALKGPLRQILASKALSGEQVTYMSTLIRGNDGVDDVLGLAGSLFLHGYPVNLERVTALETMDSESSNISYKSGAHLVDLPPYQWNYETLHWNEHRVSREFRFRTHPRHDLLGSLQPGSSFNGPVWRNRLWLKDVPWLRDHKIGRDVILPAAAYVALAAEAVTQFAERRGFTIQAYTIQRLFISSPLVVPTEGSIEILLNLNFHDKVAADSSKWFDFRISSVTAEDNWNEHAKGMVALEQAQSDPKTTISAAQKLEELPGTHRNDAAWYSSLAAMGVHFGPAFRTLSQIKTFPNESKAKARIALRSTKGSIAGESRYAIHPTTIDGCLQMSFIAAQSETTKPYLPVLIERLDIRTYPDSPSDFAFAEGQGKADGLRSAFGISRMSDEKGRLLLEAKVTFRSVEGSLSDSDMGKFRQPYFHLVWKPDIERLNQAVARDTFSNGSNNPIWHEYNHQLEELSSLCILDTLDRLPQTFNIAQQPPHLQKFHNWLKEAKLTLGESQVVKLSSHERRERVHQIVGFLADDVPEAQLIKQLGENLPDILQGTKNSSKATEYDHILDKVYEKGFVFRAICPQLQKVVELIAHREPRLRILQVEAPTGGITTVMMSALQGQSRQPLYLEYAYTTSDSPSLNKARDKFKDCKNIDFRVLDIEQDPLLQGFEAGSYDMIVVSTVLRASLDLAASLENCRKLLSPGGRLILVSNTSSRMSMSLMLGISSDCWQWKANSEAYNPHISEEDWNLRLVEAGFSGTDFVLNDYDEPVVTTSVLIANVKKHEPVTNGVAHEIPRDDDVLWLIYRHNPHPIMAEIAKLAKENGLQTKNMALSSASEIPRGSRTIVMADLEAHLLSAMDDAEMFVLGALFTGLSSAVWLTNGGLLGGANPEKSMIFGMAKSIMKAQPSLTLRCIDFEPEEVNHTRSAEIVIQQEFDLRHTANEIGDTELIVRKGVVHISRFISDDIENANFSRQTQVVPERLPFKGKLSIDFQKVGQVGSFYFKEELPAETKLLDDQVQIKVQAYALSRTEALILKAQLDSSSFSHEFVGIISGIGPKVTRFKQGERVLCLSAGKFNSTFVTVESLCVPLRQGEITEDVLGLLTPSCIIGKFMIPGKSGRTILIHTEFDLFVAEMVQRAHHSQSNIIATYSTDYHKEFLRSACAVPENCLIRSGSASLTNDIFKASEGASIDIIIASSSSKSLDKVWSCLGANGRFIILTEAGVPNLSLFDPSIFMKGVTISSVNFLDMIRTRSLELKTLIYTALDTPNLANYLPAVAFDISNLEVAVQKAMDPSYFGRVILNCNPESIVPIQKAHRPLSFNPEASYLLVGGLGGLGRSLTTWMTARGARHFIFLSRSGSDKPSAKALLGDLHAFSKTVPQPMTIQVIRGDVSVRADVDRAVTAAKTPVKGIIQAAMVTTASLFETMSLEQWNSMIRPKVQGTRNLHSALLTHEPLDFFVMTSSVLGVLGASTQTYYAAANAYLDSFARHRWSLGLQATSIALGGVIGVGHIEENPDVESALSRNGLAGIPESEFLQMMELAMRKKKFVSAPYDFGDWDEASQAHLVTGLEPGLISGATGRWVEDPRMRFISLALQQQAKAAGQGGDLRATNASSSTQSTASLLQIARDSPNPKAALKTLLQSLVLNKFSQLVQLPVSKLERSLSKPLAEFGMDSMITAELRTWGWRELKSDVPFMKLLGGGLTLGGLVEVFGRGMGRVGG